MADPSQLSEIAKFAGGGVTGAAIAVMIGQIFGGLLKGWMSGTTEQEKDLRGGMSEEIKTLRAELRTTREEMNELRADMAMLHERYLHVFTSRAEARAQLNALERIQGLPVTPWPPDPPITSGGTP